MKRNLKVQDPRW